MTLIDKAEAHDDDMIRRGDADAAIVKCKGNGATRQNCRDAIRALPARGVGVKPLVFRDETGDGVLTSRETGELFRIFPQHDGVFFAPKLPEGENTAPDAQTLIDRYNARWSARILAALAPTDAARCAECDCDDGNCTWIKVAAQATAGQRLIAAASEAAAIARGEAEPAAVYVPDAAQAREAALTVPDEIELYRIIKRSGAKKRIDVARAVSAHLEPMRRAFAALIGKAST